MTNETKKAGPEPVAATPVDPAPVVATDSVLGRLRAIREQAAEHTTTTVPAYGLPGVELKMRALATTQRQRLSRAAVKSQERGGDEMLLNADAVAAATVEILVTNPDTDVVEVLSDEDGPVAFDHRLSKLLGFEAETARDVVLAFWAGSGDRAAWQLAAVSAKYSEWVTGTGEENEADLLGN